MKKILAVAKWEYVEKVTKKSFLIGLVLMPVFIFAMAILPTFLMKQPETKSKTFGIIDLTDSLFTPVNGKMMGTYKLPDGQPSYVLQRISGSSDLGELKKIGDQMALDEKIDGYVVIGKDIETARTCEYRARNVSNFFDIERFRSTISGTMIERKLRAEGLDWKHIQELSKSVEMTTVKVTKKGEEKGIGFLETFFTSYIFIILLMFLILTTGQFLIRSLVEEKSNRIIEVLISSCSPTELMAGKILGLSGLGLTQVLVWGTMGAVGVVVAGTHFIAIENFLFVLVYFILGYLLYAAIFVGIGSLASTEQEAQQFTSYVSMILVLPIALAFVAMQNPDSTLIKVLTYIPLLTPTFMTMRLAIQMPPMWEIVATTVLLGGSALLAVWMAGKVFRVGILVYGKRPNLNEIVRWIRA